MRRTHFAACLCLIFGFAVIRPGFAQAIDETPPPELAAMVAEANAIVERGGDGPYPAEMTTDSGLSGQTIYRPRDLAAAAAGGRLPIIAWGNGACANYGNRFRYFLTEIASRGYVIFAIGPPGPEWLEWNTQLPGDPNVRPEDRPAPSHASQLNAAIDWAIAENLRPESEYFGQLDPESVAVMGMSCGGLQAIAAAADPRVNTLVVWNSGTFPEGTSPLAGTGEATKASLSALHSPVAYISGDESDIAFENANADYAVIDHVPIFRAWQKGVGHSGTYRQPAGGEFTAVALAWLDWQLRDDKAAGAMFIGEACHLCRADDWVVMQKGW
jgi:dienelactone hydrolase